MTPAFVANAETLLAAADRCLADAKAAECARFLCTDRLSEGHTLAVEAHLRALVEGFGLEWAFDYAQALADSLSDAAAEAQAWEALPAGKLPKRRVRNGRERIEEALAT